MLGFSSAYAQIPSDSVFVTKNFWGYKFYQKGQRLNFNQLPYIMEGSNDAYSLITKARTNNTISSIISGTGGFLIGWQLASAIIGGEPNWILAGVGGGLIIVSIPIFSKSHRQSLEAVEMYNAGLSADNLKAQLNFGTTENGIGLKLSF